MDLIGLSNSVYHAAINIDMGRKGFAIMGKERAGRILYEKGIADAMSAFKKAQASSDPKTIITVEYTFLSQELQLCRETDKDASHSLTKAIQSFDDAFLALTVAEKYSFYQEAEKTYPQSGNFRVNGFPKDAFHIVCTSHRTRLQNTIRSSGIDVIEKSLLRQRVSNLATARNGYVKKQKIALTAETTEIY